MLATPHALLLDFGGVLVDAPARSPQPTGLADRLRELTGGRMTVEAITRSLTDGRRAYAAWRDRVGEQDRPREYGHRQVWEEFLTVGWPAEARDAVLDQATPLSYQWTRRPDWAVRPGIREALATAAEAGLPLAIVSNTLCGAAHRDFLAEVGLGDRFAVQIYSDEAGVRKPNPEVAWLAARAIGVPVERCWFVGDSPARDVPCARRAGAGAAVLMVSERTARERGLPDGVPDVTVEDGHGLRRLLDQSR
ncbi:MULTISPECIES: HAD family hydrolase [unclassified Solwaraspora]|uniref:HAD family hydrolase n=1 Tax=unclassified Solwaraspora TaxID=2627926 RepID=UPI00259BB186|nr:HAD family hydrolase [Solwaraspora sp. WMMA2056]WJK43584.1 HAD family hydrolase [Solwaraspora sp. WMMA2056]